MSEPWSSSRYAPWWNLKYIRLKGHWLHNSIHKSNTEATTCSTEKINVFSSKPNRLHVSTSCIHSAMRHLKNGDVAQMVERSICIREVMGSMPIFSTLFFCTLHVWEVPHTQCVLFCFIPVHMIWKLFLLQKKTQVKCQNLDQVHDMHFFGIWII